MKNNNNKNNNAVSSDEAAVRARRYKKKKDAARYAMISTIAVLAVGAIVGLSVALAYSEDRYRLQLSYQRDMESNYSRSYYNLLDGTNDLDVKLRKVSVASTPEKQQSLLYEIWGSACLAEGNLSAFESNDDGLMKAVKFVNQLSDYSHYLALKLADGESLSAEDRKTLSKMGEMTAVLKRALSNVQKSLDEGKLFMEDNGALSGFSDAFKEFTDPSVEYPEMIYDGPFSDALENREPKGLKGEEIDENKGRELVLKYFENRNVSEVSFQGETGGDIKCLNFSFNVEGCPAFAQLAKKGGMLISFNMCSDDAASTDAGEPECHRQAIEFASSIGFKDMEAVWSASANGMCVVNLAPVQNGAVLYPDLVKVKIDQNTGKVIGFDSMHYAFNHTERSIPSPNLSEEEARAKITMNSGMGRLALIPLQETKEVLAYEFECENDGTYFVYIDAMNGREVNILYVIDTPQGTVMQ